MIQTKTHISDIQTDNKECLFRWTTSVDCTNVQEKMTPQKVCDDSFSPQNWKTESSRTAQ